MSTRFILLAVIVLSGCHHATFRRSMAELTPTERAVFDKLDGYYLQKAKEQATFSFNCGPTPVTVSIVSTKPTLLRPEDGAGGVISVGDSARVTVIGAEGCGQRATYQVLCAPRQVYESTKETPCDVIPSSDASRVAEKNNREQERLDKAAAEQGASQRALMQQQEQQRQQEQQSK